MNLVKELRTRAMHYGVVVATLLVVSCAGNGDDFVPQPVFLDGLDVTGAKTTLNPAFDPEIYRYSVIANDPATELMVTPVADDNTVISVNGAITTSTFTQTISNMEPGETVQIEVQGTTNQQQEEPTVYEIVYLPADFPELRVTELKEGVSSDPLYVNMNGPVTNYVAIIDNHGVPSFFRGDENRVVDFKWHPATGERSYARLTDTNEWGRRDAEHVILGENFDEVERVTTVGLTHTDLHDFHIQPNDELILVSYDGSVRDLTSLGLTSEEVVEDSVIQILDRNTKQVLFEWNSWGQVPFEDQTYPVQSNEYAHINSIVEDTDGNLIGSFRGTSQVVKISRPGGQVMWKLGGRTNQFTFLNDPFSHLCGQHTASRLGNGNILIFDNGQNCWPLVEERGNSTRVVEYRIDEDTFEAELVWSYTQDNVFSLFAGSAQRQPNGNTLIGWGGRNDIFATEVNEAGEKVFEITAFHGDTTVVGYRALRFPE